MKKKRRQTKKSAFTLSLESVEITNEEPQRERLEEKQGKEKKEIIIYTAPKTTNPSYIKKKIRMTPFPTNLKVYR